MLGFPKIKNFRNLLISCFKIFLEILNIDEFSNLKRTFIYKKTCHVGAEVWGFTKFRNFRKINLCVLKQLWKLWKLFEFSMKFRKFLIFYIQNEKWGNLGNSGAEVMGFPNLRNFKKSKNQFSNNFGNLKIVFSTSRRKFQKWTFWSGGGFYCKASWCK